ncbi:MAG: diguanylate cyclase/phosphodiesterase (GGDEF & EAL domains) with PAS/PAC sensor(s) [uncultured Solirubrobacterales bacterium]|uniref:Diguanylate cyclase/phosphodiesterase (GGDEF & EAL domains) with PAS/PAC sensor(S) n=1 Tax=uncultured Solirubrobacterales bacterium TaxID=768556 RepID=A0A6J4S9S5_9ACTN|nr:MAG: diguanylate cyclase/phosphodiesterase (GGDEF & EAL domains) with PAS/PAC sensor(s) [uncultured Solirubrobacterales bacterium]
MLLLAGHVVRFPPSVWLDGAVAALAVAAFEAALVLPPVVAASEGSLAAIVTNLAYPLADLVLLMLVVATFALTGWRPGRAWLLLGVAFATSAIADSVYLLAVATGDYVEGTLLDSLWPAATVLLGLAAWQPLRPTAAVRIEGWSVLILPLLFAGAALGLLVANDVVAVNLAALLLAAATMVAAGARTALTFHEVRALADTRRQALTDELTGLPNRRRFFEELRVALPASARGDSTTALLLIDLDGFKEINDTLGHPVGNRVLSQIGARLRGALPERASLARLGGDEFAAILPLGIDGRAALALADQARAAIERLFAVGGLSVRVGASVGISVCPEHGTDPDGLLRRADLAMYEAKAAHSGARLYLPGQEVDHRDRLALAQDLRVALERDEIILHYQPKVELATGEVGSVEALARWQHPQRGLVEPGRFVPLAERLDLMGPLTRTVLERAMRQSAAWRRRGIDLTIAVNVSIANILDAGFPEDVAAALRRWAVPPGRLQLEVTESLVLADPVRAVDVLGRLGELGVGLSLDDFGTGHASLAYLKRLPVHELKIDRSFVQNMASDAGDAAIVRASLDLARTFGLRVVAEGVETTETWRQLEALGSDLARGFLLSRPLPASELVHWLERWEPARPELGSRATVRTPSHPERQPSPGRFRPEPV